MIEVKTHTYICAYSLFSSTRKGPFNNHETLNLLGLLISSTPFHVKLASGIYFTQLSVGKVQLDASLIHLYCAFSVSVGRMLFYCNADWFVFKCPWFQNWDEYYFYSFSFSLYLSPSIMDMDIENFSVNTFITLVLFCYNYHWSFYFYLVFPTL